MDERRKKPPAPPHDSAPPGEHLEPSPPSSARSRGIRATPPEEPLRESETSARERGSPERGAVGGKENREKNRKEKEGDGWRPV